MVSKEKLLVAQPELHNSQASQNVQSEPQLCLEDQSVDSGQANLLNYGNSHSDSRQPVSKSKMYFMVLADFGLAFVWLCKYAIATPYFQHSLKAGPLVSHLVWIMGPLSGLFVAPLVGVLSDRCTSSFGRRRPFILFGAIFSILGMNMFANARAIAFGFLPAARVIAVLSFGVLDFATNVIMFPSRALFGDLLPAEQQHSVQAAAAVVASFAEICAGIYLYSWKDPVTNVASIFMLASALLAITCTVSLVICTETPIKHAFESSQIIPVLEMEEGRTSSIELQSQSDESELDRTNGEKIEPENHDNNNDTSLDSIEVDENIHDTEEQALSLEPLESPESAANQNGQQHPRESSLLCKDSLTPETLLHTIKKAITQFPRPLIKVGIVYGLAWFLWFAALPYYSQWLGVDVLRGDPNAKPGSLEAAQYQLGVSVFSIANVAKAGLAILFSLFYPTIIQLVGAIGERVVFGLSFLIFSSVLFAFAYTKDVLVAASVVALGSVPFIATQTIPIAIVVQRYPENLASNLGVLNLFCVIPQLIDTLYTGKVAELASESAVLRIAAGWGFAAAIASFFCL